jgi:hypothetical protein
MKKYAGILIIALAGTAPAQTFRTPATKKKYRSTDATAVRF